MAPLRSWAGLAARGGRCRPGRRPAGLGRVGAGGGGGGGAGGGGGGGGGPFLGPGLVGGFGLARRGARGAVLLAVTPIWIMGGLTPLKMPPRGLGEAAPGGSWGALPVPAG